MLSTHQSTASSPRMVPLVAGRVICDIETNVFTLCAEARPPRCGNRFDGLAGPWVQTRADAQMVRKRRGCGCCYEQSPLPASPSIQPSLPTAAWHSSELYAWPLRNGDGLAHPRAQTPKREKDTHTGKHGMTGGALLDRSYALPSVTATNLVVSPDFTRIKTVCLPSL
jgi:hypothetical protein